MVKTSLEQLLQVLITKKTKKGVEVLTIEIIFLNIKTEITISTYKNLDLMLMRSILS